MIIKFNVDLLDNENKIIGYNVCSSGQYELNLENENQIEDYKIINESPVLWRTEEIKFHENLNIKLYKLRCKRNLECFSVINRGTLWYETLTAEQKTELNQWYLDWLNVTETKIVPEKPLWLDWGKILDINALLVYGSDTILISFIIVVFIGIVKTFLKAKFGSKVDWLKAVYQTLCIGLFVIGTIIYHINKGYGIFNNL